MAKQTGPGRKRVQVTLSAESWALIEQVSALTKTPKAALIAELVDVALPAMQNMVEAVKLVQQAPKEAHLLLSQFGNKAIHELTQAQLDLDVAFDGRTVKGKRARRKGSNGPT